MNVQQFLIEFFTYTIFIYAVVLMGFSVFIAVYSIGETKKHVLINSFTDFNYLAKSEHTPSLSVLAPAYNEGATIIENVRSLLSIHYNNYEVIIINDGSKDNTLEQLITVYDLELTNRQAEEAIKTKPIRGIYKSRNPVYQKLIVVDKQNGGKADALNVGINVSVNRYIVCIDVDCILEQDAMLKLT